MNPCRVCDALGPHGLPIFKTPNIISRKDSIHPVVLDTRPIKRISFSTSRVAIRLPCYTTEITDPKITYEASADTTHMVYYKDAIKGSDGVEITIHECEAHWYIVTWIA